MAAKTTRGTRAKELRRSRGLTQEQLAAGTGLSVHAISALENDDGAPRMDTLEALAAFYRMTLGELLTYLDDPDDSPRAQHLRAIADLCRRLDDRALEMVRGQVGLVVAWAEG